MKSIPWVAFLFMSSIFLGHAQTLTTTETKVVLVVKGASEGISQLALFNTFEKMKGEEIFEKYPNSQFYIGLLQGSYELSKNDVIPLKGTTIIMYTDQPYLSSNRILPRARFSVGDQLDLGSGKAKVVSNKKGELILNTQ
ncbi:MAG: hypothetical protein WBN39_01200 [Flavobacteriaceae bacterium]